MKTYSSPVEIIATTLARIAEPDAQGIHDSEMMEYRSDAAYHVHALIELGDIPEDAVIVSAEVLKQEIHDAVQQARKDWYERDMSHLNDATNALNEAIADMMKVRMFLGVKP